MQPEIASVFITDELVRRGQLRPRLFQERLPLRDLACAMIDDPQRLLPLLVDSAIDQCVKRHPELPPLRHEELPPPSVS
jgi:hypothetical protein